MIRNLLALTGLLAIALVSAVGLQAYGGLDDFDGRWQRARVSYAGLDLTSPAGMRILERRVNAAIAQVCADDSPRELWGRRSVRECREQAIAGVAPQIDYAVDRAYARRRPQVIAGPDVYPPDEAPPPPPPPPPMIRAELPPPPAMRLVRRTVVTTRTVTTTGAAPALPPTPPSFAVRERHMARATGARDVAYRRLPGVPGSWLPPSAWRAADAAIVRALRTGATVRWHVPGRDGYVTVSDKRWVDGCLCRNVRTVKFADRQIVVAEGLKCLPRAR